MNRIVFVPNPHVRLDRPWRTPYLPFELLAVMGVAEQSGALATLFDVNHLVERGEITVDPFMWGKAAARLAQDRPDIVVMETWTGTLHHTLLLARALCLLLHFRGRWRARLPVEPSGRCAWH